MTKTITVCCLLLAFISPVHSQQDDTLNLDYELFKRRGLWEFAMGGRINFYDFDAMNRDLAAAGLPAVKSNVGGAFFAFRASSEKTRWTGESSFEFLWSGSNNGQAINNTASLYRDFALNFRLMYDISYRKRLTKLFPYAGFGFAFQELRTYSDLPGGGSFNQIITQDVKKNRFNSFSLPLEAGLSLEQGFKTRIYDIFIGIRGGYMYRTLASDWALNGDIITDLAQPEAGSPFVAFTLRFKTDPQRAWKMYKKQITD